ncbi:GTPase-activating protein [Pleurotus ostreatus]|uniref:GTPase-activating protein n=2 Tax=Pleurotus ostreatus TaxID=5322 RepID=A0A8H7DRS1_PLEOS|nr:GTPase-activating protein [Pleurotus ostreatus]KAF7428299.1 GTPase-activating protein [Pleurotus ostreatus]
MTARPPPARPHIGINPHTSFSGSGNASTEWGEDDAWDSGSDSESPRHSSLAYSYNRIQATPAKPVPRPPLDQSSSALAFSFTHISAPNPSSYPPRNGIPEERSASSGAWTIVRTSHERKGSKLDIDEADMKRSVEDASQRDGQGDGDIEGDMILGDLEADSVPDLAAVEVHHKSRTDKGTIRSDSEQVYKDPLHGIRHRSSRKPKPSPPPPQHKKQDSNGSAERSEKLMRERSIRTNRRHKFVDCLTSRDVNVVELRKLAWAGIPEDLRPVAWQLLLGYLPLPTPTRQATLERKREEYKSLVELAFARDREGLDQQIWHQIEIDVPRTRPGVRLWMHAATQRSLERILYVWAIRHPASGYVQGINDLVTPFFQVFLSAYIDSDPEEFDPSLLPPYILEAIEADSFWCLSRLLDGIQDNYIFAQPGIQRSVRRMAELVARIDAPLAAHLESQNVEFMQFAFRWMNCLLMREISVQNTIRMWDTYLAEGPDAFSQFHLYVCSAFLVKWSEKLRQMDFQGIIMFLQSLPTQDWGDHEIEMLLSEAFVLNSIWQNAQSHFNGK